MSYLIGSGWWVLWYALLWLAFAPFVVTTAALARATPNETVLPMETAFGVSALSIFVLIGASTIAGYFWTAAGSANGIWPYARNIMGALIGSTIIGLALIFGAGYYAVTPSRPMANRWAAQLTCIGSAALLVAFCLHATWRFRHR
jgi:hypothetical protein